MDTLRLGLAQINTTVGDLQGNFEKIVSNLEQARDAGARIVLFPELTISGYPPEDLLLKSEFSKANREYLNKLLPHSQGLTAIVGFVDVDDDIYNAAAVLHHGQLAGVYRKFLLPNYGVFDEERYFKRGNNGALFKLNDILLGVSICEDIWYPAGPPEHQAVNGAKILLNISASPYFAKKIQERERMLATRASDNVAVVAYCNLVGGQDELIFDGSSIIINERGKIIARAKSFAEELLISDVDLRGILRQRLKDPRRRKDFFTYNSSYAPLQTIALEPAPAPAADHQPIQHLRQDQPIAPFLSELEEIYSALVLGAREYVHKNGFEKVVIGLSGGIDSSLVAAIAADALGHQNVIGVSMPSRYSSDHSKSDAFQLAENLGIRYESIPIENIFQSYLDTLFPQFQDTAPNETEENLQSRARGNILMALSNKFGWLVLTTGNKSEMAVGYATLYGDMAGGFAVIKDVPKTLVFELCRYRNRISPVIPQNVIQKPPSAELRPDQFDTDSLPPYEALDDILKCYVEDDFSFAEILARGHAPETARRVIKLVDRNEYKRRQSPPGIKITSRAFGKDRRLPITNRYSAAG
ncbi:MAG: NAD+ synthase [Anaerolineaceae bacterium 4572_5.2]|nr:MAG: NAD+ synthase [Anaerolineaceae bacterium 4572_5.2]